mgnify:CR=1 FL=1
MLLKFVENTITAWKGNLNTYKKNLHLAVLKKQARNYLPLINIRHICIDQLRRELKGVYETIDTKNEQRCEKYNTL